MPVRFSSSPLALGHHHRQYASMDEHPRRRRSAEYRRKGPEPAQRSVRLAARVQPALSQLRRISRAWPAARWLLAAAVPTAVAVVRLRKRLALPPVVSVAAASLTPLAVAAAIPMDKWRYIAVGTAYMWTFKSPGSCLTKRGRIDDALSVSATRSTSIPCSAAACRPPCACSVPCAITPK